MKKRDAINLVILIAVVAFSAYLYLNKTYTEKKTRTRMGTFVEIQASSKNKDIGNLLDSAFVYIDSLEKQFSYTIKGSQIEVMNRSETDSYTLSTEVFEMLKVAEKVYHDSDSLYDLTVGSLVEVWGFDNLDPIATLNQERTPSVPDSTALNGALKNVGFNRLKIGNMNLIKPQGMKIHLGSIAKGFIVDKTVAFLKAHGATKGHINAGGDIVYFGYDDQKVRIGIQHPRGENGDVIGVLSLSDMAVVTSGDYERYFILDGRRYHHILNPKTGFPAMTAISATIVAPNSTLADALSTAVFLLPPSRAMEMMKNYPGTEAVVYYEENGMIKSVQTPGMNRYLVENKIGH